MSKVLTMKFTGNAVLTPEYPDDLTPRQETLYAIMPGARRRRRSVFDRQQIDAQFAFVMFSYGQLLVQVNNDRDADYKYPDITTVETGVCFLEREEIALETQPADDMVRFVPGDATSAPHVGSRDTKYIARWTDFALGRASLKPHVFDSQGGEYVRVKMPAGEVAAGFVAEPIARIDFDYGDTPKVFPYAQEIVVTIPFSDDTQSVTLSCTPFDGSLAQPSLLTFTWAGKPSIDLLFGNGSLASLLSVLTGPIAGHDHEGDYDVEFDVLFDIVDCPGDSQGRQPLPHIKSFEILRIPCIASMIGQTTTQVPQLRQKSQKVQASVAETMQQEFQPRTLPTQRRERGAK